MADPDDTTTDPSLVGAPPVYPNGYLSPGATPAPAAYVAAPKKPIGLAVTALVVGGISFFTGFVPVVGLILGVAGIVFGAIVLIKGQSKALSIVGLALGSMAALTSLIVTIVLVSSPAFTEGFENGRDSVPSVAESSEGVAAEAPAKVETPAPAKTAGTRENPHPFGTVVSSSDWDVTLTGFTADANAIVSEGNMFNEQPLPGTQYVLLDVTAAYRGPGEGSSGLVEIDYVGADGGIVSVWDHFTSGVDPQFGSASMYAGGTDVGKLVFMVPSTLDGTIRVKPGLFQEDVFLALS